MANETSEMRDKYKGQQGTKDVDFEDVTKIGPQGFMLENHHKEGPSKVKTTNQSKDSGIHKRLVTYIGGGGIWPKFMYSFVSLPITNNG